jgi:hypothetical protein
VIESYVITIDEVDDCGDAIELLSEKLSELKLRKNSLGIISAHADMVHSGVYDAVCKEVPFPLLGIACDSHGANDQIGEYMFSILVLTGDDLDFVFKRGNISEYAANDAALTKECCLELQKEIKGTPKLALLYTPFTKNRFPSEFVDAITSVSPGLPVFGGVAGGNSTYEDVYGETKKGNLTLCDGQASSDSAIFALISGGFTPKFFVLSLDNESVIAPDIGVVSKCNKNKLLEINGTNAVDFLKNFGFRNVKSSYEDVDIGLKATTFVLDCGVHCDINCMENCQAARQLISRAPVEFSEKGISCAGQIKEGAKVSIAVVTADSVIGTAQEIIQAINASGAKTALMYSCEGRKIGLCAKPMEELETIKAGLSGKVNYSVSYTGGEICPTCVISDMAKNHEHNQTLIACVF